MTTDLATLLDRPSKTYVPSELLEGPLSKIMGILFSEYAQCGCTDEGFKVLLGQARALGMFVSELNATHCSLAFTNEVRSMLWQAERDPKARKEMDKHFKATFKKLHGL